MASTQTLSGLTINLVDSASTFAALRTQGDVNENELWLVQGSGGGGGGGAGSATTLAGYGITDAYTKTEIDTMVGNIATLLAEI